MEIDLTAQPPSAGELAEKRKALNNTLSAINKKEKLFKGFCYLLGITGLIASVSLWLARFITEGQLMGTFAVANVIALAVALSVAIAIVGSVSVAIAFLIAIVGTVSILIPGAILIAIAIAIAIIWFYVIHINIPRADAIDLPYGLVELEHSEFPDECIQFVEWCKIDDVLRNYQHQLAEMGRKPTLGEYQAAKTWVEGSEQRSSQKAKIDKAKAACDAMMSPV